MGPPLSRTPGSVPKMQRSSRLFHLWTLIWMYCVCFVNNALGANLVNKVISFPTESPETLLCSLLYSKHSNRTLGCAPRTGIVEPQTMVHMTSIEMMVDALSNQSAAKSAWIVPIDLTWTPTFETLLRERVEDLAHNVAAMFIYEGDDEQEQRVPDNLAKLNFPFVTAQVSHEQGLTFVARSLRPEQRIDADFYMGPSTVSNSSDCLKKSRCLPIGGLSVWSQLGAASANENAMLRRSDRIVLLSARSDDAGVFHDLPFGTRGSSLDVSVLLTVAHALGQLNLDSLPRKIVAAVFQAEAFHRIGSRRFLRDVIENSCRVYSSSRNTSCADPPAFSLEWTRFPDPINVERVISLDRALSPSGASFVRAINNQSVDFASLLGIELGASNAFLGETSETAAATSFAELDNWNSSMSTAGVVFSGYSKDSEESRVSINGSELEPLAGRVVALAKNLGKFLLFQANDELPVPPGLLDALQAVDLIGYSKSVLECLVVDFSTCAMAMELLDLSPKELKFEAATTLYASSAASDPSTRPLPTFTGVYLPGAVQSSRVKLLEAFIRNALSNSSDVSNIAMPSPNMCSSDVGCRDQWAAGNCPWSVASNASRACVAGKCVCARAFYHDAWSADLELNLDRTRSDTFYISNKTSQDPIWTEPYWQSATIRMYGVGSSQAQIGVMIGGIAVNVVFAGLIWLATHKVTDPKLKLL